jgi:hypothetical protein
VGPFSRMSFVDVASRHFNCFEGRATSPILGTRDAHIWRGHTALASCYRWSSLLTSLLFRCRHARR